MLARPQLSSMQLAAQFVRDEGPFRSCRIHIRRGIALRCLFSALNLVWYIISLYLLRCLSSRRQTPPEADPALLWAFWSAGNIVGEPAAGAALNEGGAVACAVVSPALASIPAGPVPSQPHNYLLLVSTCAAHAPGCLSICAHCNGWHRSRGLSRGLSGHTHDLGQLSVAGGQQGRVQCRGRLWHRRRRRGPSRRFRAGQGEAAAAARYWLPDIHV